jgi:hypothetical protein
MNNALSPDPEPGGLPEVIAPPPIIAAGPPLATEPAPPRPAGPWGFWATLGFSAVIVLAYLAAQLAVVVAWSLFAAATGRGRIGADIAQNGLFLAVTTCVTTPVAFGLTWLFASLRRRPSAADYLGFRPVGVRALAKWTIAMVTLVALSDTLTFLVGRPIVPDFMRQVYRTAGFTPLLWIALMVGAPAAEEPLFRGFLFEGLRHSKLGAPGAIILTALLWSIAHVQYDVYGVASIFAGGLLLGYVRLKTGSLYATMFLHSLMNLIATLEAVWVLR